MFRGSQVPATIDHVRVGHLVLTVTYVVQNHVSLTTVNDTKTDATSSEPSLGQLRRTDVSGTLSNSERLNAGYNPAPVRRICIFLQCVSKKRTLTTNTMGGQNVLSLDIFA